MPLPCAMFGIAVAYPGKGKILDNVMSQVPIVPEKSGITFAHCYEHPYEHYKYLLRILIEILSATWLKYILSVDFISTV